MKCCENGEVAWKVAKAFTEEAPFDLCREGC